MIRNKHLIIILVCLLFIVACTPSIEFEGKVKFKLQEEFTTKSDGAHIFLSIDTQRIFACTGYSIEADIDKKDEKIMVTLGNIKPPTGGICGQALSPASFKEEIDIQTGQYTLEFHQISKVDTYSLEVTPEKIYIKPVKSTFSNSTASEVNRTPKDLLKVTCGFDKFDKDNNKCKEIFANVETFATPYLLAKKDIPTIQYYKYDGPDDKLIELLKKYRDNGITITTGQGKEYIPKVFDQKTREYVYNEKPRAIRFLTIIPVYQEPKTDISQCEETDSYCYAEVAINTGNSDICLSMPTQEQQYCFTTIGKYFLDINLCDKATSCFTCKEECYTEIVLKQNKPNYCEKLTGNYRDGCNRDYAIAKRDFSYCSKLSYESRREYCFSQISIKINKPELCEEVTGEYRDGCYRDYAKAKKDDSLS